MDDQNKNSDGMMFDLSLPENEFILGNFKCIFFNWGRIVPTVWNNTSHRHCHYEACYSYEGKGLYINDNKSYQINENQWCFARPGEFHQMFSGESSNWGIFCMCFSLIPINNISNTCSGYNDILIDNFMNTDKRSFDGELRTESICELLSLELTMQQNGYEKSISGIFAILMIDFLRSVYAKPNNIKNKFVAQYGEPEEIRIQKAVRFIEMNIFKQLTIKDVADSIYLSERQLTRVFRKVFSASPLQVINRIRINCAMQMLAGTTLSLKEISNHCGFSNERYFMSSFRKHTGMTAGQFRKECLYGLPKDFPAIKMD